MTDFWTSLTSESFMTMSIHWITWDWRLKMCILGTINFPKDHTAVIISNKLMDLRLEFGLYPKSSDGRTAQCPNAVRLDKLLHFRLKSGLDKPMLTSDCGSDVLEGRKKTSFGIGIVVLVIA